MRQLSLFDGVDTVRFPDDPEIILLAGTIVRQAWPWIGWYDVVDVYWQVRSSAHPGFEDEKHYNFSFR